ncbi:hypothetical protein J6590_031820 [Homalodisca vitripennis]|nr:hypothetical protein J6590_031820 [Homalodisca vitripennis]
MGFEISQAGSKLKDPNEIVDSRLVLLVRVYESPRACPGESRRGDEVFSRSHRDSPGITATWAFDNPIIRRNPASHLSPITSSLYNCSSDIFSSTNPTPVAKAKNASPPQSNSFPGRELNKSNGGVSVTWC